MTRTALLLTLMIAAAPALATGVADIEYSQAEPPPAPVRVVHVEA